MKKRFALILAIALFCSQLFGCGAPAVAISLSKSDVTLSLFGETEIVAECTNTEETVTWTKEGDDIIEIVPDGNKVNVEAIGTGTAKVVATIGEVKKECNILVETTTEKILLSTTSNENVTIKKGMEFPLETSTTFLGQKFSKGKTSFISSDSKVATVDENGKIKAVAEGTAEITMQTEYKGHKSNIIKINVTVMEDISIDMLTENVTIYVPSENANFPSEAEMGVYLVKGEQRIEDAVFTPSYTTEGIATVENGKIKAVAKGETSILLSCTYKEKLYESSINVTVKSLPSVTIELSQTKIDKYINDNAEANLISEKVVPTLKVDSIEDKDIKVNWSVVEGSDVVSVAEDGTIKGKTVGFAKVKASADYKGIVAEEFVTISIKSAIMFGQHENYKRDGMLTTISEGKQLNINDVTLTDNKDVPVIRINKVNDKLLANKYTTADKDPKKPDDRTIRDLQIIFITFTDALDPENYITIGLMPYRSDNFWTEATACRIGARSCNFPAYTDNDSDFMSKHPRIVGRDGGYGACPSAFSFYGYRLNDLTDKYTLGFSVVGTSVYYIKDGTTTLLCDLNKTVLDYSVKDSDGKAHPEYANCTWTGFKSNKVNITISGDYYESAGKSFTLSILDLEGKPTTAKDVSRFTLSADESKTK